MQAVVALCHFCESHGPRVVVTCQPMRNMPLPQSSTRDVSCSTTGDANRGGDEDVVVDQVRSPYYGDCRAAVGDTEERCNACCSFGSGPCLLSNDHTTKTSYVSSQIALSEPVFDRVKYACLRSLSCEVSTPQPSVSHPKKPLTSQVTAVPIDMPSTSSSSIEDSETEGLRVDEADGHVFFGDTEHGYTLSLTFRLPDTKARGLHRLYSLIVVSNDMTLLLNNHNFFLNALNTIKEKIKSLSTETFLRENREMRFAEDPLRPENASRIGRLPQSMFTRRITLDTQRSLQTITGDEKIWSRLHRQMMWTLRTQTLRTGEAILEGVPTQDMLVMMEMDQADIMELDLDAPNARELTLQQLNNLRVMAKTMSADGCTQDLELLLKHVVCGGQVVVESDSRALARQLLLSLSNLLPIGCIKMCGWSEMYQHRYLYNLLGCPLGVDIPLDAEECLVLRLLSNGVEGTSLSGVDIEICRRPHSVYSAERPVIASRYKMLLLDSEVTDAVLDATVRAAREQWVAKAKQVYQLQRQSSHKIDIQVATRVVRATSNDRNVLTFWQSGLSKLYKAHVLATIHDEQQMSAAQKEGC